MRASGKWQVPSGKAERTGASATRDLHGLRRLLLATVVIPTALQAQSTTEAPRVPLFTWNDAYLGGAFVVGTLALRPVDKYFATKLQNKYTQSNHFLQDVAVTVR